MAYVQIQLPGESTALMILCSDVKIGGKKNLDSKPNANLNGPVEVQTNAYENLKIVCSGVHFTKETGTLLWSDVIDMYTHKFTGANPYLITITYGDDDQVTGLAGTTEIPVLLESFNFPLSVIDSKNAYLPVGSLTFVETASD